MAEQSLGDPLPALRLPDLGGGEIDLDAVLAGKRGAVVVFWSGICSHCRRYDDYLGAFADRHPDLALLVVACRQDETLADLRQTATDRALSFPILYDPERQAARAWLVRQTPRTFLLDAQRRLRYRGAIDNFKYPQDPDYVPYLEPALAAFAAGEPIERQETASFGCPVESVYYDLPKPLSR
ncbi:MAG: redoxin domain-containing protein [Acidobacteriota bacterium]